MRRSQETAIRGKLEKIIETISIQMKGSRKKKQTSKIKEAGLRQSALEAEETSSKQREWAAIVQDNRNSLDNKETSSKEKRSQRSRDSWSWFFEENIDGLERRSEVKRRSSQWRSKKASRDNLWKNKKRQDERKLSRRLKKLSQDNISKREQS